MNKQYDEYDQGDPYKVKNNINSEFHKRRFDITLEFVLKACNILNTKKPKVLDVGCGEGYITYEIKKQIPEANVFGIDNSTLAIKTAKNFNGINFIFGDAMNLTFDDNYFDIVVCNNLIEHVDNPNEVLKEIKSKLKDGGYIIISTPSFFRIENIIKLLLTGETQLMSEFHFKEYSIKEMLKLLKLNGYKIVDFKSRPLTPQKNIKNIVCSWVKFAFKSIFFFAPCVKHGLESTVFYLAKK